MRTLALSILSFSTLVAPAIASAQGQTMAQIRSIVKTELAPQRGWLENAPSSYKPVAISSLTGPIARTASELRSVSTTFDMRERTFGKTKVYVIQTSSSAGQGADRLVLKADGKPLF